MRGLYVHIPFCVKKCRYCDFLSAPCGPEIRERYVDALVSEIRRRRDKTGKCQTVFIGGGTPSVLTAGQLEKVVTALRESFDVAEDAEFTAEANPESLTREKALAMRALGVNRLSIGFQSLSERALGILGRVHSSRQAVEAFYNGREAGFDNINVDLIFGIPGETGPEFRDTLERVISLSPEHVSAYSLIVEEGTALCDDIASARIPEPDDGQDREDYHFAVQALKAAGYCHYEISNFAKPGHESKHNLGYWEQREYFGFGPSAASFNGGRRYANVPDVTRYIETGGDPGFSEDDFLGEEELAKEFMMLGFRLTEGPDFGRFREKYSLDPFERFRESFDRLEGRGLIVKTEDRNRPFRLTPKGLDLANEVFREFV